MGVPGGRGVSWTLLTGHGRVLVEIARDPEARIRDIAAVAGITEHTAQVIVADLETAGYITRTRAGRRTRYTVNHDSPFPPPSPGRAHGRPVPGPAGPAQGQRRSGRARGRVRVSASRPGPGPGTSTAGQRS
jgi:hypothetical protein